jgi:hypothetical protein
MKKLIGILLVVGALIVNVPYMLLISNFNYPDILREPASVVLTKFAEGGNGLIATWLLFALSGLPLLFAIIMLSRLWAQRSKTLLGLATVFGIVGLVAQFIGLLRWVFVVPVLAQGYVSPEATEMTKEASVVAFQTVNQFGGVLLGEYVGQLFTILSMLFISVLILRERIFGAWLAWLGFVASGVYLLAQTELFHTVMPSFPSIDVAGFAGSVLWLVWMICLGVMLIRNKDRAVAKA